MFGNVAPYKNYFFLGDSDEEEEPVAAVEGDRSKKRKQQQRKKTNASYAGDANLIHGLSMLFFETIRGPRPHLHSRAVVTIGLLLECTRTHSHVTVRHGCVYACAPL